MFIRSQSFNKEQMDQIKKSDYEYHLKRLGYPTGNIEIDKSIIKLAEAIVNNPFYIPISHVN